ncbi:hypothetical protein [Endozoicomonas numazuensis]|uniref:Uncharacterized protein n=1 Tax=Endozoicomonas numazuensis TaxID=1137799 RepID=A0A081NDY8_9GAMM|nr:hypothetical protein [Endozoicomonas numazuensis]KEQ16661.1 hypothetical protein GZ78_18250 [Endozoicomonas numazuensis]
MLKKKFSILFLFLSTSIASADSAMILKINSIKAKNQFKPSIRSELSKCLSGKCAKLIPDSLKSELYSNQYIESPEDSFFSVSYIFNKAIPGNQLNGSVGTESLKNTLDSFHSSLRCDALFGVEENSYIPISGKKYDRFDSSFEKEFQEYRQGRGLFFILIQPNSKTKGKKNIFHCTILELQQVEL